MGECAFLVCVHVRIYVCMYVYMYVCTFLAPLARTECNTRSIFMQAISDFFLPGWLLYLAQREKTVLLFIYTWREKDRFMTFPKCLARSEAQIISSRIRTRVTDSISY